MKTDYLSNPKISALFKEFSTNESFNSYEEIDKDIYELFQKVAIIHYGLEEKSPEDQNKFLEWFNENMRTLDSNNPRLTHPEKAIKRLGQGKFGETSKYIEDLLKSWAEDFSELQSKRASYKRPESLLDKRILELIQINPTITERELLNIFKSEQGMGLIEDIDEDEIYTTEKNGAKSYKISGLKNRLSRLKNN